MRDSDPFPVSVDLDRGANTLDIAWEDGGTTHHTGEQLRWACPCAECRGEAGQPGRLDLTGELGAQELRLADIGLIGQYALQIGFASGHNTGIYTFRRLRTMDAAPGPA